MTSYVGLLLSIYVAYGAWGFVRDLSDIEFLVDRQIERNHPRFSAASQRWVLLFLCFVGVVLAWPLTYLGKRP